MRKRRVGSIAALTSGECPTTDVEIQGRGRGRQRHFQGHVPTFCRLHFEFGLNRRSSREELQIPERTVEHFAGLGARLTKACGDALRLGQVRGEQPGPFGGRQCCRRNVLCFERVIQR